MSEFQQQEHIDPNDDDLAAEFDRTSSRAPVSSPRDKKSFNLLSGLRDKSSKRLLIIVGGIATFCLIYAIWPNNKPKPISAVQSAPSISVAQGSEVASPAYSKALTDADQQRAELASEQGTSALPTVQISGPPSNAGTATLPPIGNVPADTSTPAPAPIIPSGAAPAPADPSSPSNPSGASAAVTNRTMAPNVVVANQTQVQAIQAWMTNLGAAPQPAQIYAYQNAGAANDASGADGSGATGMADVNRSYQTDVTPAAATTATESTSSTTGASQAPAGPYAVPVPGTLLYSQMISAVDSDDPGPVMAEIVQGPLAGARLLGSFQTHTDGVVLSFNTMTIPYQDADGNTQTQVLPINAIAVSSSTLNDAMATSVNDHLALRLGVSFVSSLLGNFGNLLEQSGATTTMSSTGTVVTSNPTLSTSNQLASAAGQAAGQAGSIVQQEFGNLPPTIKVASGTPFGLLFTTSTAQ